MSDTSREQLAEFRTTVSTRLHTAALRIGSRVGALLPDDHEVADFLRGLAPDVPEPDPVPGRRHPLDDLAAALRLDRVDVDVLLLAGLADEHESVAAALRSLHPTGVPAATTGLAAALADAGRLGPRRGDGSPARVWLRTRLTHGTLVTSGALRTGDGPFWERPLVPAEGLWPALHGDPGWPGGLVETPLGTPTVVPAALQTEDPQLRAAMRAVSGGATATVLLVADDPAGAALRFAALARVTGAVPVVLHAGALDADTARRVALVALARNVVPVITAGEFPDGTGLADDVPGPVVLAGPVLPVGGHGRRPVVPVAVLAPTAGYRNGLWRRLLPEVPDPASSVPPGLGPQEALAVVRDARTSARLRGAGVSAADVRAAAEARSADTLPGAVVRITPSASWTDLVLSEDRLGQLDDAVARVRRADTVFGRWGMLPGRPGRRGVRLLFHGPPGTGKTLAAEVLARRIGRELLVVDLSRMVSKWIGETEKNLAEAFDAAERGDAVLLFDEADALFGRRTEVGDARDRYANLETAYLLSRLAVFDGVAVLATNLRQNIDPAFARRLEFVLSFELPDRAQRLDLWRRHLRSEAPLAPGIDLDELAALYPVSGALIRNAVLTAAFAAADQEASIGPTHLADAVRREYAKAGQAFPGPPPSLLATSGDAPERAVQLAGREPSWP